MRTMILALGLAAGALLVTGTARAERDKPRIISAFALVRADNPGMRLVEYYGRSEERASAPLPAAARMRPERLLSRRGETAMPSASR